MTKYTREAIKESLSFVEQWLDDDNELPIPNNDFGNQLSYHLSVLTEIASDEINKQENPITIHINVNRTPWENKW